MLIDVGEKLHVVIRRNFEQDIRRHFVGEVTVASGSLVRVEGYTFIFDPSMAEFVRKPEKRTRIFDLSACGYIVNVLPARVNPSRVVYTMSDAGLVAADDNGPLLDINEFGSRR